MQIQFLEFIDRKQREARKHLKLIEKLLKKSGVNVSDFLEDESPYLFVSNPLKTRLDFEGIRVYEIGEMIAYRVQRDKHTEPYGKAYMLDLEDMFNDFMSENIKEEEAGKKVVESVVSELKKFFEKSAKAEAELQEPESEEIASTTGTDYGRSVFS